MKAVIYIDKNESLKAGIDSDGGNHTVVFDPFDLSQEQRDELAVSHIVFAHGDPHKGLYKASKYPDGGDIIAKAARADLETLKMLLDERINRRKAEAAEKERRHLGKLQKFLKTDIPECIHINTYSGSIWSYGFTEIEQIAKELGNDEAIQKIELVKAAAEVEKQRIAEKKAAKKATQERLRLENIERVAAEKKQKEAERLKQVEQIKIWVAEKGSESQKARLADDLLPGKEIVDGIRDEAYQPLDTYDRYVRLRKSDVCCCDTEASYEEYCDVTFDVEAKDSATEDEFEIMQGIRELMPGATVTLREHTGEGEQCDNTVTRGGIMVETKVGAFNFSREYAAE